MGNLITDTNNPLNKLSLNRETINKMLSYDCIYHDNEDVLFFCPANPKPATSFDWNGELWFRIDPQTEEIVGIEIENFEKVFIKKHPELAPVWNTVKPSCWHKVNKRKDNAPLESFIRIILEFLSSLLEKTPQQLSLRESPA